MLKIRGVEGAEHSFCSASPRRGGKTGLEQRPRPPWRRGGEWVGAGRGGAGLGKAWPGRTGLRRSRGGRGLRAAQPRDFLASGDTDACAPHSRLGGCGAGGVCCGVCGDRDGGSALFGSVGPDCGLWH